jgi:hypothetical protein
MQVRFGHSSGIWRSLSAQETTPKYEVGVNYSWLHVNSANCDYQRTGNGGSGYIEYNLDKIIGLVADFGGYANTRTGIDDKALTYLFGPRFNWRHSRLSPVRSAFSAAATRGVVQITKRRTPSRPWTAAVSTIT